MTRPGALPAHLDCAVVGGGPAGAALAGLLAAEGAVVALIDDGRAQFGAALETLLPAALPALDRCGLGAVVRAAAAPDERRHGARWDDDSWRWRDDGGHGLCLRRGAFDERLRAWAAGKGAVLLRPATVLPLPAALPGELVVRQGQRELRCAARTVVLATGRRGAAALLPVRDVQQGPATAAFAFVAAPGSGHEPTALIAACADGWCWWIGDGAGGGSMVVAVDAGELRRVGRRQLVSTVLAAAGAPFAAFAERRPTGAVRATARWQRAATPVLLLGDAAATLDPLASQGTEKALVGAETAAVAVRTALDAPARWPLCVQHHASWERELFVAHQRAAAGFYARPERFAMHAFWQRRRPPADADAARTGVLPARLVAAAEVCPVPALRRDGDRLVPVEAFALPGGEPQVRIGRVAVGPLLAAFAQPSPAEAGIAAAGQDPRLYALGTRPVRDAVVRLVELGMLRAADG